MAVINTNIKSLITQDALNINNRNLSTAMERLSTGYRINSASDDAAGLAISTRMETQIKGLTMAVKMRMMEFPLYPQQKVQWKK